MKDQGSRFTGLRYNMIGGVFLVAIGLAVILLGVAVASVTLFIIGVIDLIVGAMLLGSEDHRR